MITVFKANGFYKSNKVLHKLTKKNLQKGKYWVRSNFPERVTEVIITYEIFLRLLR